MIRKAFVMKVNADAHEEYQRRHDQLWPEMAELLKGHGAHNYSIFLDDESSQLFGYVEIESEERWNAVAETAACQRWWAYMADIMVVNTDSSPKSKALESVFYLA